MAVSSATTGSGGMDTAPAPGRATAQRSVVTKVVVSGHTARPPTPGRGFLAWALRKSKSPKSMRLPLRISFVAQRPGVWARVCWVNRCAVGARAQQ